VKCVEFWMGSVELLDHEACKYVLAPCVAKAWATSGCPNWIYIAAAAVAALDRPSARYLDRMEKDRTDDTHVSKLAELSGAELGTHIPRLQYLVDVEREGGDSSAIIFW
jgi:hypothetical protein